MSQPATARPHLCLYFVKVCCLLLCLLLFSLTAHPARAQWSVVDENGKVIPYQNGGYPLHPSLTGTVNSTYPQDSISPRNGTFPLDPLPSYANDANLDVDAGNSGTNCNLYGFWRMPDYSYQPENGTVTGTADGHLEARYVYTGPLPAPPSLDLMLSPTLIAETSTFYSGSLDNIWYPPAMTSGLSSAASVAASVTLNGGAPSPLVTASAASADANDGSPLYKSQHTQVLTPRYLVRVPVVNGVARVAVDGQMSGTASNPIACGIFDPHATTVTNGPTSAYSEGDIYATIQQAGPPKSILINRPENTGANIEADRKVYDYGTSEWTCYGDSRFDNAEYDDGDIDGTPVAGSTKLLAETWQAVPLSGPWPPVATCISPLELSGDWDRYWHWYIQEPISPSRSDFRDGTSFAIADFTPNFVPIGRAHMDWPYSNPNAAGAIPPSVYLPHDLLEEMTSSRTPQPQTWPVDLHLSDKDDSGKHPEYAFDHHATFKITYHNANEIVQQFPTPFVPTSDNPWRIFTFNTGSQITHLDIEGNQPNWVPQVYYEANKDTSQDFSVDFPIKFLGFTAGAGSSQGTNNGLIKPVTQRTVPAGWHGYVYTRPLMIRCPFTYHKYTEAGRVLNSDVNGNDQPFSGSVDRNQAAYNGTGDYVPNGFDFEMKIVLYPDTNQKLVPLLYTDTDPYGPSPP